MVLELSSLFFALMLRLQGRELDKLLLDNAEGYGH